MTDVFLERTFPGGITPADVMNMAKVTGSCLKVHNVGWKQSYLSADGHKLFCWFTGRDAESARIALRQSEVDTRRLWPGTIHSNPEAAAKRPNVLVERSFPEPAEFEQLQAIEESFSWCLEAHRVDFVQTFFSTNRKRMICLYHAPDAESVRQVQHQTGLPVDLVWPFQTILD